MRMRVLCLRVRINTHIPRRVLALPIKTSRLCAVVIDMFSQSVVHCCEAVFSTLGRYKFTVDSEITVQSRMMINVYFKELNCLFCQMV